MEVQEINVIPLIVLAFIVGTSVLTTALVCMMKRLRSIELRMAETSRISYEILENAIDMTADSIFRTGVGHADYPEKDRFYVVNKIGTSYGGSEYCQFSYLPKAEVWGRMDGTTERTRRIGFKAYRDELIDVDNVDYEEMQYFLGNRKYRRQYESMLPVLTTVMNFLREEKRNEEEFKKLVKSMVGREVEDSEVDEAIRSFKTRRFGTSDERKWKRGISNFKDDGRTALRQILKMLGKDSGKA